MERCENVIISFCVIKGCQMWCKVTNDVLQMGGGGNDGWKKICTNIWKVCVSFQISGIGKVSEKMLNALGISSCSHLSQQMALLSLLFSETAWHHFMQVSLGLGSTHIPRYLTVRLIKLNAPDYSEGGGNTVFAFFFFFTDMKKEKAWALKGRV